MRFGSMQGLIASSRSMGESGLEWAQWAARKTGRTGWILMTTAVVTLVPLVFEVGAKIRGESRLPSRSRQIDYVVVVLVGLPRWR